MLSHSLPPARDQVLQHNVENAVVSPQVAQFTGARPHSSPPCDTSDHSSASIVAGDQPLTAKHDEEFLQSPNSSIADDPPLFSPTNSGVQLNHSALPTPVASPLPMDGSIHAPFGMSLSTTSPHSVDAVHAASACFPNAEGTSATAEQSAWPEQHDWACVHRASPSSTATHRDAMVQTSSLSFRDDWVSHCYLVNDTPWRLRAISPPSCTPPPSCGTPDMSPHDFGDPAILDVQSERSVSRCTSPVGDG